MNAGSYLAVLVGLFRIRLPARTPRGPHGSPFTALREGIAYIWRTDDLRRLIGVVVVFAVFGVPYLTLMPVVARDVLGLGAGGYGVLLAAVGVGGFAGALFVAGVGTRVSHRRLLVASSFAYALLLIAFAFVRSASLARVVLLAVGFAMVANGAMSNAMLQARVDDAFRGRVMSVYAFAVVGLAQVVGSFLGGAVARLAGPDWAIGGGAVVMLLYGAWAYSTGAGTLASRVARTRAQSRSGVKGLPNSATASAETPRSNTSSSV